MSQSARNRGTPADASLTDFADRLERFFRDKYTALLRQHLKEQLRNGRPCTVEDVQDAFQEAMLRIYERFADGSQAEPDNLAAYLNVTIRNVLIDKCRRQTLMPLSDAFPSGASGEHDSDEDAKPAFPDPQGLSPEDILAWKQLLHTIVDRLAPKWVGIAAMMMGGKSPVEIGTVCGLETKKVYVLTRHTRDLICKILGDLTAAGDPLAKSVAAAYCLPAGGGP